MSDPEEVPPGKLFITGMRVVPKKPLSKAVRRLAGIRSKMAVRRFAARYKVAVEDAERPLDAYESVLDFFTRRLRPGIRPIDADPRALVSPVDGAFLAGGPIGEGRLYQAKGRDFTLAALLADPDAERTFARGTYATLYLAPRDYHRIHAPAAGGITSFTYVPGQLFPVNAAAVAHVSELFAKNERLITYLDADAFGRIAVVKVGATCVGHITLAYDAAVATNVGGAAIDRRAYDPPIPVEKGAELGVFEMGSTVIVVTERPVELLSMERGAQVVMGRAIGYGPPNASSAGDGSSA
jgi:phosphatidylserine decarboxylase